MTYDTFMNKPAYLKRRILHQADEVAFRFEVCTRVTSNFGEERVQTSRDNKSALHNAVYIDENNKLLELTDRYDKAKADVLDFLYNNLEPLDADLLEWRYINDKDMTQIAKATGDAYKTVRNKMSQAERKARKVYGSWQVGTTKDTD